MLKIKVMKTELEEAAKKFYQMDVMVQIEVLRFIEGFLFKQ